MTIFENRNGTYILVFEDRKRRKLLFAAHLSQFVNSSSTCIQQRRNKGKNQSEIQRLKTGIKKNINQDRPGQRNRHDRANPEKRSARARQKPEIDHAQRHPQKPGFE